MVNWWLRPFTNLRECQRANVRQSTARKLHANEPHGAKSSRKEAGKQYELQYTVGSSPSCQDLSLSKVDFGCSHCRRSFSSHWGAVGDRGYSSLDAGLAMSSRCKQCNQRLVEIDNYGERLIGCIECNRWSWRGSKRPIELPEDDLEALKAVASSKARHRRC